MDVASCSGTGGTNVSYDISSLDALPHLCSILPIVGIIGGKTMTMGDHNNITSACVITGKDNNTICCRRDGGASASGNINTPVKLRMLPKSD